MDSLINSAGLHEWSGNYVFSTLYCDELGNMGPQSVTTERAISHGMDITKLMLKKRLILQSLTSYFLNLRI